MVKTIVGGVLGGIVAFAWGWVFWGILPFAMNEIHQFSDEAAVQQTVMMNAPEAGIYMFPHCGGHKTASEPAQQELKKKAMEQMANGPIAIVSVNPNGTGPFNQLLIQGLVISVVGGLLIALLLSMTRIENFFSQVLFVTGVGLTAGVLCIVPDWNWWGVPINWVAVRFADVLIGWFLAGLVIAGTFSCPVLAKSKR